MFIIHSPVTWEKYFHFLNDSNVPYHFQVEIFWPWLLLTPVETAYQAIWDTTLTTYTNERLQEKKGRKKALKAHSLPTVTFDSPHGNARLLYQVLVSPNLILRLILTTCCGTKLTFKYFIPDSVFSFLKECWVQKLLKLFYVRRVRWVYTGMFELVYCKHDG